MSATSRRFVFPLFACTRSSEQHDPFQSYSISDQLRLVSIHPQTLELQVVHSDLKSLNILLTRGWDLAKIGDVGVARFMHSKEVRRCCFVFDMRRCPPEPQQSAALCCERPAPLSAKVATSCLTLSNMPDLAAWLCIDPDAKHSERWHACCRR